MIEYVHPTKKDVMYMVSTDREILLDIQAEQAKQRQEFSEFKAVVLQRLDNIEMEMTIIKHDQATLQTGVYWVLGAVGIFLAALGIPAIVASVLSVFKTSESKQADSKQADTLSITNSLLDAFTKGLAAGRAERE